MGYESISTFLLAPSPTAIESPIVRPLDGDLHKLLYYTLATYSYSNFVENSSRLNLVCFVPTNNNIRIQHQTNSI